MRLTSKGLGRITLPFQMNEAEIRVEDGALWLRGRIKERSVNWDYRLRLEEADIVRFIALARSPEIVRYLADHGGGRLYARLAKRLMANLGWVLTASAGKVLGRRPPAPPAPGPEGNEDAVLVEGAGET